MSVSAYLLRTVTRLRAPTVVDRNGDQVRDWPNATTKNIDVWLTRSAAQVGIANTAGDDSQPRRDVAATDWTLVADADADIAQHDRIIDGDTTWTVADPPLVAQTPRGPHHVEARLTLVKG